MAAPIDDLDEIDRRIVDRLVADGRLSWSALGAEIGLSANATGDRVRALVRRGVIDGFSARLGDGVRGRTLEASVDVRLRSNAVRAAFERLVLDLPAVVGAVHLTGAFDYQLSLACADTQEIDATIAALKDAGGVTETRTRIVLRRLV